MNERIRQLAIEAGYEKDMFGIGHWDMPECKKFAELIIREAADIATMNQHQWHCPGTYVLKHFGIDQ